MIQLILSVALVLVVVLDATLGTVRTRRALATFEATPANRVRYYQRLIAYSWVRAATATLVTFTAGLSLADIGVSAQGGGPTSGIPDGASLAWPFTIVLSLSMGIGAVRLRHRMRAGYVHPQRARIAAIVPRTTRERRYAAALAVTAGITEEVFFRGALIALGIEVFHLPALAAAALSLILFVSVHAYQGRLGMLGVGFLGLWLTALTLLTGSLLPAMVLHIASDLWALLVVPANPTPQPTEAARSGQNPEAVRASILKGAAPSTGTAPTPTPREEHLDSAPLAVPTIRSPAPARERIDTGQDLGL